MPVEEIAAKFNVDISSGLLTEQIGEKTKKYEYQLSRRNLWRLEEIPESGTEGKIISQKRKRNKNTAATPLRFASITLAKNQK